jgi:hypothetical protein
MVKKVKADDERKLETRIRVRLDFEVTVPGHRVLPDWLMQIPVAGIEALQVAGKAPDPLTYHGCRCNLAQVDDSELKRREARARKNERQHEREPLTDITGCDV